MSIIDAGSFWIFHLLHYRFFSIYARTHSLSLHISRAFSSKYHHHHHRATHTHASRKKKKEKKKTRKRASERRPYRHSVFVFSKLFLCIVIGRKRERERERCSYLCSIGISCHSRCIRMFEARIHRHHCHDVFSVSSSFFFFVSIHRLKPRTHFILSIHTIVSLSSQHRETVSHSPFRSSTCLIVIMLILHADTTRRHFFARFLGLLCSSWIFFSELQNRVIS